MILLEAEMEVYFVEEKEGDSFSGDSGFGRAENYPLSKPMVDHDQKCIKAKGRWQISNKVTEDLLKWLHCHKVDWSQRENSGMCIDLILLACSTSLNILVHIQG